MPKLLGTAGKQLWGGQSVSHSYPEPACARPHVKNVALKTVQTCSLTWKNKCTKSVGNWQFLSPKFGNAMNKMISLTLALFMIFHEKIAPFSIFSCDLGEIFRHRALLCLNTGK